MTEPTIDQLKSYIEKVNTEIAKLRRGCQCEYDYRCGNCQRIVDLHTLYQNSPL